MNLFDLIYSDYIHTTAFLLRLPSDCYNKFDVLFSFELVIFLNGSSRSGRVMSSCIVQMIISWRLWLYYMSFAPIWWPLYKFLWSQIPKTWVFVFFLVLIFFVPRWSLYFLLFRFHLYITLSLNQDDFDWLVAALERNIGSKNSIISANSNNYQVLIGYPIIKQFATRTITAFTLSKALPKT